MDSTARLPGVTDEGGWFRSLRDRFRDVAARRVAADAVDDVVQDAMKVVLQQVRAGGKGSSGDPYPPLAWCFQTLRNVIGDHYRRDRRVRARLVELPAGVEITGSDPDPIEALASDEIVAIVTQALDRMTKDGDACARYLRRLGAGVRPSELAREEGLDEGALYRRVYRCRQKLRAVLRTLGVDA